MGKIHRQNRKLQTSAMVATEFLERRILYTGTLDSPLQSTAAMAPGLVVLKSHLVTPDGYTSPNGAPITPALMRDAYGLGTYNASNVTFNGVQGTGAGQTIALVEGGSDPDVAADLTAFDSYWGLPDPPSFQQLNATGGTTLPAVNGDQGELDLDVEWAHVMAPQASLVVYCGNLYTCMTTAAAASGVSVISISYGISGTEGISEFETPSGHNGVTFLASTGDTGGTVVDPAKSPAVVAVGGTDLTMNGTSYGSETGWSAGGGGINTSEAQPNYQSGIVSAFSTTQRTTPDVALDADPSTGVAVYDLYDNSSSAPWEAIVGGTSLSAPLMGGIVAVADQGRVAAGLTSLDGYTQTLPRLYQLYSANYSTNFHDITTGNNTHAAGTGYDLSTGLGSPIANKLIPDLAGADTISGRAYIDINGNGTYDAGTDTALAGKTVYLDLNGSGTQTLNDPTTTTDANGLFTFSDVIGSWTGKVRLAGSAGYLTESNTTVTTAYDTAQTYNLVFASSTTYTATASPTTVTAATAALGVTVSGTAAANLTYTWAATTSPAGSSPVFSANGTAAAINTNVTFNLAGTYVFAVTINNGSGEIATSSVTVVVNQTITSIVITPVAPNITGGTTQQMTATALDQFGSALVTQPATFTWSVTAGNGSISSTGLYTAPAAGTLATVKAVYSTFSATQQIYVVSSPWASVDIGSPAVAGTAFDTGGVFNLSGGGTGITGTSDQFHYVYRALGGDGTIIARVATQSNSNTSAGAGVMIRSSLAANAQQVLMGITPGSGGTFESRTTVGGTTTASSVSGLVAPYWVKLVRSGNTITGYDSSNGTTWVLVSSATVQMTGSIYIGMFDTAHSSATGSTATFDNITLMDAADDSVTVSAGTSATVSVLANDVGPTGDTLTITGVTQGSKGSVVNNSNGTITYSTNAVSAGTDSFTYTISDGAGDTATATVTVNILGLVAYYKMNEGTGTTTADASGNGNTATLVNTTWTTGVAGNGLNFNGSNAQVTLPVMNLNTNTVTFSGWFYSSGTQSSSAGLIFNRASSDGNGLDMYNGTTLGYTWGTAAGTYNYNSGLTLPTGTWTFAALVITGTNATIYMQPLGGALKSATNALANAVEPFSTSILLGDDSSSSTRYFNGSMDEVRIYNTALSLSAVTALGLSGSFLTAAPDTVTAYAGSPGTVNVLTNDSGPNGSTLSVTGFTQPAKGTVVNNGNGNFTYSTGNLISGTDSFTYTLTDGLGDTTTGTVNVTLQGMIAYYKFDEGSGLAAIDATGDGYTGTLNNTTYTTGLTGLSTDHALLLNGSSSDVTFATSPSLNGTGNFSVGAWIKTSATSGGVIIQQRDANGFEGEYALATNSNGTVTFYLYNNGYQFDITTTQTVNNGKWHQITGVRNGSSGFIYIDGVQAGTGSGTALSLTGTITVAIGEDSRDSGSFFNGTIDNAMIFNNALSASELATLSTLTPAVATAAAAAPNPTTATTTALSVSGSDYYEGESNLTYTWAATTKPAGATTPTFSINGNNAAKATTATFYKAGSYVFTVTITDTNSLSITSMVSVTVTASLSTIAVTPASSSIFDGQTVQLSATAYDQFGIAIASQPTFNWSITGAAVGNISSTGLYTAPASGAGSDIIQATSGSISGTATVTTVLSVINGTVGNDTIRLVRSGVNLVVYENNASSPVYTVAYASIGSLSIDSLSGDDSVNIDFSGGASPVPAGGLTVNGGGGTDSLIVTGTTGNDIAAVNASSVTLNSSTIVYSAISSITINGNGGSDSLAQTAQPANAATLTFNGGTSGGPSSLDSLNVSAGTYSFAAPLSDSGIQPISLASLAVGAGSSVTVGSGLTSADRWVLVLSSLGLTGSSSQLNLGSNDLIIHNGNLPALNAQLQNGYNGGNWVGNGIASSAANANTAHLTALGIIQNTAVSGTALYSTFDNQAAVSSDVLIKYTYLGDANLDGKVDASDYSRIDNGYLTQATGWFNGDFNYDRIINGSDYTLIDNAFNTQGAIFSASIASQAIASTAVISAQRHSPAGIKSNVMPHPFSSKVLAIMPDHALPATAQTSVTNFSFGTLDDGTDLQRKTRHTWKDLLA